MDAEQLGDLIEDDDEREVSAALKVASKASMRGIDVSSNSATRRRGSPA